MAFPSHHQSPSKASEDSVQEGLFSERFSYALAWMHVQPAQKAITTIFLLSPMSVINSLVGMNFECPTQDTFTHRKRKKCLTECGGTHIFNLTNTWVAESGDLCELKASRGYKVRPCFKNKK